MRAAVSAVAVALVVAAAGQAKSADFFTLALSGASPERATVCGAPRMAVRALAGTNLRATVRSRHAGPFVIAVRKCRSGRFTTTKRLRVDLPAGKRTATLQLGRLGPGEYRIEARLNGDRPAPQSATRHLVVERPGPPRIESADYGTFQPTGASHAYRALRIRTLDPDGQVVGMTVSQISPKPDHETVTIADGGCGLGGARNGAGKTFYLPMELAPGEYTFRFELDSSGCGGPAAPESVTTTATFEVK